MANAILYFIHFGIMNAFIYQTPIGPFPLSLLYALLFHSRRQTETVKKGGYKSTSNVHPSLQCTLKPEELAEMNVKYLIKEKPMISGKELEIMSKRKQGVALDNFVLE